MLPSVLREGDARSMRAGAPDTGGAAPAAHVLAMLVGAALGLSGAVLQGLTTQSTCRIRACWECPRALRWAR